MFNHSVNISQTQLTLLECLRSPPDCAGSVSFQLQYRDTFVLLRATLLSYYLDQEVPYIVINMSYSKSGGKKQLSPFWNLIGMRLNYQSTLILVTWSP